MSGSHLKVTVRPAARDDIPEIVEIARNSVSEEEVSGFGGSMDESPYGDAGRLSAKWTDPNRMGDEEIFVAELAGEVVGRVSIEERGSDLELIDIDVRRELQRQGIGTQIVAAVEALAKERGRRSVTLGTSRNAEGVPWKSLPWWQARGYRVTHEEENAWTRSIGPGVREIRMRKDLG